MNGLFAAVVTPLHADGRADEATDERLLGFLLDAGVDGVCLGGATSEYPHVGTAVRAALIRRAAALMPRNRTLLVGIGAPTVRQTLELGARAVEAGSRAVLLPMPMFFRYAQEDLEAYCAQVARTLAAPCLLYDLPEFTNPLAPATTLALLHDEEFIVGVKDSSGCEANLPAFAAARAGRNWTLLVGDDRLLSAGVRNGWNGGVSGVAGFCPELLVALYRNAATGAADEARRLQQLLDELIAQISIFPVPWGIRIGLAARGLDTGPLPLPVTAARRMQIAQFTGWFGEWRSKVSLIPDP